MPAASDLELDVSSGLTRGAREHQEDALACDFSVGGDIGFSVLADGMGGHSAGDIASRIVVTEVFSELKFRGSEADGFDGHIPDVLRAAADNANACIRAHARANPQTRGMGTTLVATLVQGDQLFWLSIGDSPLFLFRDGRLRQLNEDHSLAPQIDFMVQAGLMDAADGVNHPDRNLLTSVILGERIERIDCPEEPLHLRTGDIVIAASDGVQFLGLGKIEHILRDADRDGSAKIAQRLLDAIEALADPDQDNAAFSVIRVVARNGAAEAAAVETALPGRRRSGVSLTRLLHVGGQVAPPPVAEQR